MNELRRKALEDCEVTIIYLKSIKNEEDRKLAYWKACGSLHAYRVLGIFTFDEFFAWTTKFANATEGVSDNE